MAKKLLSFLGTGNYTEVIAYYEDKQSSPTRFITESLAEIFCSDWTEEDEIVIFVTETSERKNWMSNETTQGLKERLTQLSTKNNWAFKSVKIPEGKNEDELWQIFNTIFDAINYNDEIILDITHGFRSIPMLCFVVLSYARFLKNIKINAIVYGALEALGRPKEIEQLTIEKRLVPVFDLTLFQQLFDWTTAAKEFLVSGNTASLEQIGQEELKKLFKAKGSEGPKKLRKLFKSLESFRKNTETCRGPQLKEDIEFIKRSLNETQVEIEQLPAFVPIYKKITEEFTMLETKNELTAIHSTVKWCSKNGLVQQAVTLLRENVINFVMIKNGYTDLRNQEERGKIEEKLNDKNAELQKEIKQLWKEIRQIRNDINHAGYRPQSDYRKAEKFMILLNKAIERFDKLLE